MKINDQNMKMLSRLQNQKSNIDFLKLDEDEQKRQQILKMRSYMPKNIGGRDKGQVS